MTYWRVAVGLGMLVLAGCAGTSGTGGAATASGSGPREAVASNTADDGGVICKQVQRTGTRISQRVCTTPEQRRAAAEVSRDARDAVNSIGITATQAGGPKGS
ncbi:MAG: hypothetical protein RIC38_17185 [Chromatocurvus sp.]